jgi:hypothetical protein
MPRDTARFRIGGGMIIRIWREQEFTTEILARQPRFFKYYTALLKGQHREISFIWNI